MKASNRGMPRPASAAAEVPPDSLQHKHELIAHYDRSGYPERARYLERAHLGPGLLMRVLAGDLAAAGPLLEWWTGAPPADVFSEFMRMALLGDALQRASSNRGNIADRAGEAAQRFRLAVEDALRAGLSARVNARLQPFGPSVPWPDSYVHSLLIAAHTAPGGEQPAQLRVQLPPPHHDGITQARVLVCERCTHVFLSVRPATRCRFCSHRRPVSDGAILAPETHPESPFLIIGDGSVYARTCLVCGNSFRTSRKHAQTCPDKSTCRGEKRRGNAA